MERSALPASHHSDRMCVSDERQSKESLGLFADAGQRPHYRYEPHYAVSPRRCFLPDGKNFFYVCLLCPLNVLNYETFITRQI